MYSNIILYNICNTYYKKDLFKHSASFALKISIDKQTSENTVFLYLFFVK